jgi:mRNA interferase MazF
MITSELICHEQRHSIRKGDIFAVDLEPVKGAETGKVRPCVVILNDLGNQRSPVTIIACITTTLRDSKGPIDVYLTARETGLQNDSRIMLNQIRTIDIARLGRRKFQITK